MQWRLSGTCFALISAFLSACSDSRSDAPSAPSRDELQQAVIGDAAAGLDATGHFRLPASVSPVKEVTQSQAIALASVYITTAGLSFRRTLEKDRGGPIDIEHLQACGQAVYAATAFEPLGPDAPPALRRHFGSWWLVAFCGKSGGVEASVAVSALATELTIAGGRIDYGRSDGNEFFPIGTPPGWDSPVGLSPERAVVRMGHRTGRRINQVPRLIAADPRAAYPQGAVWRIQLESRVHLRGRNSGRVLDDGTIYAGLHEDVGTSARMVSDDDRVLRIPAAVQPPDVDYQYPYFPSGVKQAPETKPTWRTTPLRRQADVPIKFEPAAPTAEN
jgi:hypothetical protein